MFELIVGTLTLMAGLCLFIIALYKGCQKPDPHRAKRPQIIVHPKPNKWRRWSLVVLTLIFGVAIGATLMYFFKSEPYWEFGESSTQTVIQEYRMITPRGVVPQPPAQPNPHGGSL